MSNTLTITDYTFSVETVATQCYICLITNKATGVTFGIQVGSNGPPPPDEWVFNAFQRDKKGFFIDVPSETIKEEIVKKEVDNPPVP